MSLLIKRQSYFPLSGRGNAHGILTTYTKYPTYGIAEIFHGRNISPKLILVYCMKISLDFIFASAVKVATSTV